MLSMKSCIVCCEEVTILLTIRSRNLSAMFLEEWTNRNTWGAFAIVMSRPSQISKNSNVKLDQVLDELNSRRRSLKQVQALEDSVSGHHGGDKHNTMSH